MIEHDQIPTILVTYVRLPCRYDWIQVNLISKHKCRTRTRVFLNSVHVDSCSI